MELNYFCAWISAKGDEDVCITHGHDLSWLGFRLCATKVLEHAANPTKSDCEVRIESIARGCRYTLWRSPVHCAHDLFDAESVFGLWVGHFRVIRTRKDTDEDWTSVTPELATEMSITGLAACVAWIKANRDWDIVIDCVASGVRHFLMRVPQDSSDVIFQFPPIIVLWNAHWREVSQQGKSISPRTP